MGKFCSLVWSVQAGKSCDPHMYFMTSWLRWNRLPLSSGAYAHVTPGWDHFAERQKQPTEVFCKLSVLEEAKLFGEQIKF